MKTAKLILSRPKIVADVQCPKCKSHDIVALLTVETKCKNCNTVFVVETKVNVYYSIAMKLIQLVSSNDETKIAAERDPTNLHHADDILKPQSQHEQDMYHTLLAIQKNFKNQKCWEVSEITHEMDESYKVNCNECGVCNNCVTCTKCGKAYTPKIVQTKGLSEKRYTCPSCGHKKFKRSYVKFTNKDGATVCPLCGSSNMLRTYFNSDKKQCPRCDSKNITKPKIIPVYMLKITRQKRFFTDGDNAG